MDFDQLHTFLEVARALNFSQAAKRCFRTQPAVSAQIRALEEEVGARLFNRTGGKVSITAAGIAFKAYAEQVLDLRLGQRPGRGPVRGRRGWRVYSLGLGRAGWLMPRQ